MLLQKTALKHLKPNDHFIYVFIIQKKEFPVEFKRVEGQVEPSGLVPIIRIGESASHEGCESVKFLGGDLAIITGYSYDQKREIFALASNALSVAA